MHCHRPPDPMQDDPIQIERALERGEERLRERLHPDPYIGEAHPGSALCTHSSVKGFVVVLSRAATTCSAGVHRCPWCCVSLTASHNHLPTHHWLGCLDAVPYRPGGSMYARNPPFDPSVHIHLDFGREGGH